MSVTAYKRTISLTEEPRQIERRILVGVTSYFFPGPFPALYCGTLFLNSILALISGTLLQHSIGPLCNGTLFQ